MRLAIVSDVHANQQALSAVLTDIIGVGVDRIISLGDLVGYGPQPAEVLELAYARIDHFVLGNHDAVVAGLMEPAAFNPGARQMIEWTTSRLDGKAGTFLGSQPYLLTGDVFRCSHGNPASPATFAYLLENQEALDAWQSATEQIIFVGHSHVPGLFVLGKSGTPHWLEPQDFAAEASKRYIVNVGSVGQPRNGDVRASYCLYDVERGEVRFRQVPFDLEAYRRALDQAGSPMRTAYFLTIADQGRPQPLREVLDFHPPTCAEVSNQAVTVQHLDRVVRSARRWRLGAAALLVLLLVALAGAWYLYRRTRTSGVEFAALHQGALVAPSCDAGCLPMPEQTGRVAAEQRLDDWTVRLTDPKSQSVAVRADDSGQPRERVFCVSSKAPLPVVLASRPVQAGSGMRFQVQAYGRPGSEFQGYAEIALLETSRDGISRPLVHCPLENLTAERWKSFRRSSPAEGLKQDAEVRWELRGQFTGELLLRDCDLRRTK